MKTPRLLLLPGLLAAIVMTAPAGATTVSATTPHAAESGMDVVVATVKRPSSHDIAEGFSSPRLSTQQPAKRCPMNARRVR